MWYGEEDVGRRGSAAHADDALSALLRLAHTHLSLCMVLPSASKPSSRHPMLLLLLQLLLLLLLATARGTLVLYPASMPLNLLTLQ